MQPLARSHLPGQHLPAAPVAARAFDTACGLRIEIHQNITALTPFVGEWADLAARCRDATFFAGPEWAAAWMDGSTGARPCASLILVRDHGQLVALLPLAIQRVGPLRSASGLCTGASAYTDLLADSARVARQRLLSALWLGLDAVAVDTLTFDAVREGSLLDELLAMRGSVRGEAQSAVLVPAAQGTATFGSASLRKDLRRRRRRLIEEKGPVSYHVVQSESDIPAAVHALLALKLAWLDGKGLHARFLARPETPTWLIAACRRALKAGKLHLSVLSAGGEVVAAQLAFRSGDTLCAYIGAFDPAYKRYGAGKLHLEDHLADIAQHGLTLDLMPPEDAYKMEWGVPGTRVCSCVTALSARGRVLAFVQSPNLRTAMKSLYMAMPRAARAKTAAAVLAAAAAVRRTLMSLAAPMSEVVPHLTHAAALA